MDWSMSSETIETLEYADRNPFDESPPDTAVEQPVVSNFWDEIMAVIAQCYEAGGQFCACVVNWAPWKAEFQRAVFPEADYSCVDAAEREIQLTAAVEREINLTNAMQGLQAGF